MQTCMSLEVCAYMLKCVSMDGVYAYFVCMWVYSCVYHDFSVKCECMCTQTDLFSTLAHL